MDSRPEGFHNNFLARASHFAETDVFPKVRTSDAQPAFHSSAFADWLQDVIPSEAGLLSGCGQISK
jgi:hypothetical protein